MKTFQLLAACLLGMCVSGCGISRTNYDTGREVLRGSPAVRSQFVQTCTRSISRKPLATRQRMAKVMGTSLRNTPSVYCRRMTRGIASGRISHADLNGAARGHVTPKVIRVLQGR